MRPVLNAYEDEPTRESSLPGRMARSALFPDIRTEPSAIPARLACEMKEQLRREAEQELADPSEPYLALSIVF